MAEEAVANVIPQSAKALDTPREESHKAWRTRRREATGLIVCFAAALLLPLTGDDYFAIISIRAMVYWILISGLTLLIGYAGQLAIGYVGLLMIGGYVASVLTAGIVVPAMNVYLALGIAVLVGGVVGIVVGLPALRLTTFYFAMATLGFASITNQLAIKWTWLTGGSIGVAGPSFPVPFASQWGLYVLCWMFAAAGTYLIFNLCNSGFGRSLLALRDMEVAAEVSGIRRSGPFLLAFLVSGALAGLAGALFASLQGYITPDAFTIDLSLLFFISVLIGGRTSVLGPFLGTVLLTILPEIAAPLVKWSTFLYSGLLLLIVLVLPGGLADALDFGKAGRRRKAGDHALASSGKLPPHVEPSSDSLALSDITIQFGGLKALDGLDLQLRPGTIHGLIGPNGSGKTTALNVINGFYKPTAGSILLGDHRLDAETVGARASHRIARTFQTPRCVGDVTVLENVMMGRDSQEHVPFLITLIGLGQSRSAERALEKSAMEMLEFVGLAGIAHLRADELQHSELRFLEIARALMLRPAFLLLDEPAAGLAAHELARLAKLVQAIRQQGTAVLLVEHHTELVFEISDHVTVLNLGRVLAEGSAEKVRSHREVIDVYLGQ